MSSVVLRHSLGHGRACRGVAVGAIVRAADDPDQQGDHAQGDHAQRGPHVPAPWRRSLRRRQRGRVVLRRASPADARVLRELFYGARARVPVYVAAVVRQKQQHWVASDAWLSVRVRARCRK